MSIMKQKIYFKVFLLLVLVWGCKKIQEGFLSDTLRYKDRVIYAKKGLALTLSDRINADGSTPPITYKMENLRERNSGKPAPEEFFTEYDVLVFKEGIVFNPEVDTTVELLNEKRELKKMKPMEFNQISGQISFNRASSNLPVGEFTFDLEAKNVFGTKNYNDFAEIHVIEPTIDDLFELTYSAATGSDAAEVFTTIKAPKVSVQKVSNDGARVILKYTDKNGRPFDPSIGQVIKRGDRPMFETYARFNPVLYTDTAMICDFEVAPFPLQRYIDPSTDWGFLIYYRIPAAFISIDGLPNQSANPVVEFRLKMEGTYIVEVRLTDAVRIT